MRLTRLVVRGFRNLADATLAAPPEGAVLVGANGQGKTSLLEAIAYPVTFRSFRGALDTDLVGFGGDGFHLELGFTREDRARQVAATFRPAGREKRLELDGAPLARLVDGAGAWLVVVFAPEDVRLASGPAAGRRVYLDRMLSLSNPGYLAALVRYRRALTQRNAGLRRGRPDLAAAFDQPLARAGAAVVAGRLAWVEGLGQSFTAALAGLGEGEGSATLAYRGDPLLADPLAWPGRLAEAAPRDQARRITTVGPHRDDLDLRLDGRSLREFGSTGQHRSAAVALKLLELAAIERGTGCPPALLLDDVFAELDADRQRRLAERLLGHGASQVFITAPRPDELPAGIRLPVWRVAGGRVSTA